MKSMKELRVYLIVISALTPLLIFISVMAGIDEGLRTGIWIGLVVFCILSFNLIIALVKYYDIRKKERLDWLARLITDETIHTLLNNNLILEISNELKKSVSYYITGAGEQYLNDLYALIKKSGIHGITTESLILVSGGKNICLTDQHILTLCSIYLDDYYSEYILKIIKKKTEVQYLFYYIASLYSHIVYHNSPSENSKSTRDLIDKETDLIEREDFKMVVKKVISNWPDDLGKSLNTFAGIQEYVKELKQRVDKQNNTPIKCVSCAGVEELEIFHYYVGKYLVDKEIDQGDRITRERQYEIKQVLNKAYICGSCIKLWRKRYEVKSRIATLIVFSIGIIFVLKWGFGNLTGPLGFFGILLLIAAGIALLSLVVFLRRMKACKANIVSRIAAPIVRASLRDSEYHVVFTEEDYRRVQQGLFV